MIRSRLAILGAVLPLLGLVACGDRSPAPTRSGKLGVASALSSGTPDPGFARALAPRTFTFPADHGPHPEYQTEWWYVTGNLTTPEGRPFGFQWTIFRQALKPEVPARSSQWGARDVYLGHFAISDPSGSVEGRRFHSFERFRRGALGLAGATAQPFRVALDDWVLESIASPKGGPTWPARLRASAGEGDDRALIDLTLDQGVPPVLEGDGGLSKKSAGAGNASYYYSLPRMPARGEIRLGDRRFAVSGLAWLDREWSTSVLAPDQVGWDWFALQLDGALAGQELMLYRLRGRDGSASPESRGTLIAPDGTTRAVSWGDLDLQEAGTWTSPKSGARYPAAWRLRVPTEQLDLTIRPLLAAQELNGTFRYWEGAVEVSGTSAGRPVAGKGYVELTGYADAAPPPR